MAIALGLMGFNLHPFLFIRDLPAADHHTRRTLEWARATGFDAVEMEDCWIDFYSASASRLRAFRDLVDGSGIHIGAFKVRHKSLCQEAVRNENREKLIRAVEVADVLGTPVVSVSLAASPSTYGVAEAELVGRREPPGSSRSATPADIELTVAGLQQAGTVAAACGITIAIELHQFSVADTSAAIVRLLEAVALPNVRANPDLGNVLWAYSPPAEHWSAALERLAPLTAWWHCKNLIGMHVQELQRSFFTATPLWHGDIDYSYAIAAMHHAGYRGGLVIEGLWNTDNRTLMAESLRYVRSVFAGLETVKT